ncbi:MAG: flagellar FlbD family protein [Lachnospiraceae bacterium]|nr:flagellar FlbD family protein [Lachnospiraceae bacterium]
MIKLTKLNGEIFILNCVQIEVIESIPESKVILMNKEFFIVRESPEEIIDKVMEYFAKIEMLHKHTVIIKNDNEY